MTQKWAAAHKLGTPVLGCVYLCVHVCVLHLSQITVQCGYQAINDELSGKAS